MGPDAIILVFWMLSFKPTFSLSSFTFIKRFFNSSSLSRYHQLAHNLWVSQSLGISADFQGLTDHMGSLMHIHSVRVWGLPGLASLSLMADFCFTWSLTFNQASQASHSCRVPRESKIMQGLSKPRCRICFIVPVPHSIVQTNKKSDFNSKSGGTDSCWL